MSGLVFLELEPREVRYAKIAISKTNRENYGRGDESYDEQAVDRVIEEFGRGFDDLERRSPMRLEFRGDDAALIASAVAIHARDRRDRDHFGSAKKYQSIADTIEHQLLLQGVLVS